jgi:hypothetical protein
MLQLHTITHDDNLRKKNENLLFYVSINWSDHWHHKKGIFEHEEFRLSYGENFP